MRKPRDPSTGKYVINPEKNIQVAVRVTPQEYTQLLSLANKDTKISDVLRDAIAYYLAHKC